ncbi:MAG: hypothetical protein J6B45_02740 [Clostridia bacterium]|nr:hypothetical protein [Clostridia bacterium]
MPTPFAWALLVIYSLIFLFSMKTYFKGKFLMALGAFLLNGFTVFYFLCYVIEGLSVGSFLPTFTMIAMGVCVVSFLFKTIAYGKGWFSHILSIVPPMIFYCILLFA